jgi:hypothetical protein
MVARSSPGAAARDRVRPVLLAWCLMVVMLPGCTQHQAGVPATASGARSSGWLSGAAGDGVADGQFGRWRDAPVLVAGTWVDTSADVQVAAEPLDPAGEYAQWSGSLDVAVGAIFRDSGESWSAAAAGAYDQRWSHLLTALASKWSERSPRGTLFIRFAHEWNGSWSPWAVDADQIDDFITAWRRFYKLKTKLFPQAKLVFCTNGDTSGFTYDWRRAWPGDQYVDAYGTDWYSDQLETAAVDEFGAPAGLDQHREFALSHGKPFTLPEWGNRYSSTGDSPQYVGVIHDFAVANAGTGAGQLLYEIYFNVHEVPNEFALYPTDQSLAPRVADAYRQLF